MKSRIPLQVVASALSLACLLPAAAAPVVNAATQRYCKSYAEFYAHMHINDTGGTDDKVGNPFGYCSRYPGILGLSSNPAGTAAYANDARTYDLLATQSQDYSVSGPGFSANGSSLLNAVGDLTKSAVGWNIQQIEFVVSVEAAPYRLTGEVKGGQIIDLQRLNPATGQWSQVQRYVSEEGGAQPVVFDVSGTLDAGTYRVANLDFPIVADGTPVTQDATWQYQIEFPGATVIDGPNHPALEAYVKASNPDAFDHFGRSLAVAGNTVVVGAPEEKGDATGVNGGQANAAVESPYGAAYVLTHNGSAWTQQAYLKPSNTSQVKRFGKAIAISEDTVVVGAPEESSAAIGVNGADAARAGPVYSGAAYVFVRDTDGVWSQQAHLKASNPGANDQFGTSVAIAGDTIVVGAPEEDGSSAGANGNQNTEDAPNSGALYVFTRSNGVWTQQAYLKSDLVFDESHLGNAAAISEGVIVAGASSWSQGQGAAYVFRRQGAVWDEEAFLSPSGLHQGDQFGCSVAISGAVIVAGVCGQSSPSWIINDTDAQRTDSTHAPLKGAAIVFTYNGTSWPQSATLRACGYDLASFGKSVAISRGRILVGAPGDGDYVANSGKVFAFENNGAVWQQVDEYKAPNLDSGDQFGGAVAIADALMVMGATSEAGGSAGINGDGANDTLAEAGAVYVFRDPKWDTTAPPAPVLQTVVEKGTDLVVTDVSIVSEADLEDGRHLFEFTLRLRNAGAGLWQDVGSVTKRSVNDLKLQALQTTARIRDSLAPGQVVQTSGEHALHVVVGAADQAPFEALVTSGALMQVVAQVGDSVATNPAGARIERARVLGVTTLPSGQKLIEFTADVRNDGVLFLRKVDLKVDATAAGLAFSSLNGGAQFTGLLSKGQSTATSASCWVICEQADAAVARAGLLGGLAIEPRGIDVMQFRQRALSLDVASHSAFLPILSSATSTEATLFFSGATPLMRQLESGDLLVNSTSGNDYFQPLNPFNGGTLDSYLPLEVTSIAFDGPQVILRGKRRNLIDVAKSGTFTAMAATGYHSPARDPFAPALGNTFTAAENAARTALANELGRNDPFDGQLAELKGFNAIPFHFNDFSFPGLEALRLSGEMLVHAMPIQLQITKRLLLPRRVTLHSEVGYEVNALLELDTGLSSYSNHRELFPDITLAAIPLTPEGLVTLEPTLIGNWGVDINVPAQLTLPLLTSATVGVDMTWDSVTGVSVKPFKDIVPLAVSDPSAFDDYQANAKLWMELGFSLELKVSALAYVASTVTARGEANASFTPLLNPWWRLGAGVGITGQFDLSFLAGVFNPVHAVQQFPVLDFSASSADGARPAPTTNGPVKPLAGRNLRWGRALGPTSLFNNATESFAIPFGATGDLICGWRRGMFARITGDGDLVWMRNMGGGPVAGVALGDGTFTLLEPGGNGFNLANYNGTDGARLWDVRPNLTGFGAEGLAVRNVGGAWEYFVVGIRSNPDRNIVVVKLNATGEVAWAKECGISTLQDWGYRIKLLADGNLIIAGATERTLGGNTQHHGLLVKMNPDSGAVLWATQVAGYEFVDVAESPDGLLFALGHVGPTASIPVISVARFTPVGSFLGMVQVGPDPDFPSDIPSNPYWEARAIHWANGGLWASGTVGLSEEMKGWVARLNGKLAVAALVVMKANGALGFNNLDPVEDGLVVTGRSTAVVPWPTGGTDLPVVLKLPWEGIMRFHEDSTLSARFLRPRVYNTAGQPGFVVGGVTSEQFAAETVDVPVSAGAAPAAPTDTTSRYFVPLERQDPSAITSYDQWAYYHQLAAPNDAPEADSDNDGVSNALESYFNLDPHAPSVLPPLTMKFETIGGAPVPVLEFERAAYAEQLGFGITTSTDLLSWEPLPANLTTVATPAAPGLESVWIYSAAPEPRRFYRAEGTPAPSP